MSETTTANVEQSVALYWDFENLHASLVDGKQEGSYGLQENRFRAQEVLIDVEAVVDLALSYGRLSINRAYCNWQFFGRYRDSLLQGAVELIQMFSPGGSSKNGADIRLCLDALEDITRFKHIDIVIVVAGDSDFMPLAQKVKAAGKRLIGIGDRRSTNRHWAKSCHEFRYYESIAGIKVEKVAVEAVEQLSKNSLVGPLVGNSPLSQLGVAANLVQKALSLLSDNHMEAWVNKAQIGQMIRRLEPSFEPREYGFDNFRAMLKALDPLIEIKEGEHDQLVRLRVAIPEGSDLLDLRKS